MKTQANFYNPPLNIWDEINWHPSKHQFNQFCKLQNLLKQWNQKVNLTRLTEGNDYWISQIIDSLWPLKNELINPRELIKIIDIGTGCGFPGLAIAIAIPNANITLVDSVKKKSTTVQAICKELGLNSRVSVLTERAETTGHSDTCRSSFDFAIARAVATAPVLAEYLIPLLNSTGEALLYKGKWNDLEHRQLINALKPLNSKIKTIERFKLPENKGIRHLIRIAKYKECPQEYPRSIGIPKKNPLGSHTPESL